MPADILTLDGSPLSIEDVVAVACGDVRIELSAPASEAMVAAHDIVQRVADGDEAVYGINTGFGALSQQRIDSESNRELQLNLIRSHAAGVGTLLPDETVRAMQCILAASLARGRSGVRPELVQQIIGLLNAGIVPLVPSRGSVGASGDLAPLSHAALALIGEGDVHHDGRTCSASEALASAGLKPIALEAKEGLALINGTHLMAAQAALSLDEISNLFDAALAAAAMAFDACLGSHGVLDSRIHEARCQPGQIQVAAVLSRMLDGSAIVDSHKEDDPRVQDPYCLRATPQVLGAALDSISSARSVVVRELGAVTDNPLVFPDAPQLCSGGNFHGMPLAIAMDTIAIALSHVAGISERRVYWLQAAHDEYNGVPAHLSPEPGLHSGLMITQYTAAACCNELRLLATPASVGNISTAAGIEDYNSMGATAGNKLRDCITLAEQVIAIELLNMAAALDHHRPLLSGAGVEAAYEQIRSLVPPLDADRSPAPDIESLVGLIRSGTLG
ncbi:MAG: histidine ammonia-lyase [Phycisphaerales bacterium]|nr:histidine ammonia-lyase [Phycisphaerales bacterium]